jgi:hypothetical protein
MQGFFGVGTIETERFENLMPLLSLILTKTLFLPAFTLGKSSTFSCKTTLANVQLSFSTYYF